MNYPEWLEIFLAICMGLALAGLGAWMFYTAAIKLIKGAIRLEDKRTNKETGPALVGVELGNPGDYRFLLERIDACGMKTEEVAYDSPYFTFLV